MNTGYPPIYLFLDFDGVLHRNDEGARPFEHADPLGLTLADFPEVVVVVSSTWREAHVLGELRAFCGSVLGPRLEDVTPAVKLVLGGRPILHRFSEIAFWLATHPAPTAGSRDPAGDALARSDWIALDDCDCWFPRNCIQLIHIANGRGLDETHLAAIQARLVAHRESARRAHA